MGSSTPRQAPPPQRPRYAEALDRHAKEVLGAFYADERGMAQIRQGIAEVEASVPAVPWRRVRDETLARDGGRDV